MKRSNSIIAIIGLVILTTTAAVVSCKKEKQVQTSNEKEQSSLCFDNMDEYLISFKKKLISAQKGSETISLEQAQRDLGNLLNFDLGDANYPTDVNHFDTLHANLTLSNGYVELSQLAETYTIVIEQILDAFNNINLVPVDDLPYRHVYPVGGNNIIILVDNIKACVYDICRIVLFKGFSDKLEPSRI